MYRRVMHLYTWGQAGDGLAHKVLPNTAADAHRPACTAKRHTKEVAHTELQWKIPQLGPGRKTRAKRYRLLRRDGSSELALKLNSCQTASLPWGSLLLVPSRTTSVLTFVMLPKAPALEGISFAPSTPDSTLCFKDQTTCFSEEGKRAAWPHRMY